MGRIPRLALLAANSPRIRASNHRCGPGNFTTNLTRNPASMGFSTRFPEDFGLDGFLGVLPWRLIRTVRPNRNFYLGFWACLLAHAPVGLLLPAFFWPLPTLALALIVWSELCRPKRRSRRILSRVEKELEAGSNVAELGPELEEALYLDSGNDAARLLLAASLLEHGDDASVLLHLAPLRDRHPEAGILVLLAGAAYLHLGRPMDAIRMLEALEVDEHHPSFAAVQSMLDEAFSQLGHGKRHEPPQWGGPIVEGFLRLK